MVIAINLNSSGSNNAPKTKKERLWYLEHEKQLNWARESQKCPSCNAKLDGNLLLYDHGYKCGLECEFCR